MLKQMLFAATIGLLMNSSAGAHVTLEQGEAPVGATYKAVFRIAHGCNGKPTNVVRLRIPEGVIAVKPMPKPGWTLEKVTGAYAKAYDSHGKSVTEGVTEVTWKGGELADDEYDEFVLRAMVTPDLPIGGTIYFPIVQECESDAERWIEIPAEGQTGHNLEMPAPSLKLLGHIAGH